MKKEKSEKYRHFAPHEHREIKEEISQRINV
jgi:hypothetical protein